MSLFFLCLIIFRICLFIILMLLMCMWCSSLCSFLPLLHMSIRVYSRACAFVLSVLFLLWCILHSVDSSSFVLFFVCLYYVDVSYVSSLFSFVSMSLLTSSLSCYSYLLFLWLFFFLGCSPLLTSYYSSGSVSSVYYSLSSYS